MPAPSTITSNRGSPPSQAPIQEENEDVPQLQPQQQQQQQLLQQQQLHIKPPPLENLNSASNYRRSINDQSLFTSPSMPNISLGRPHLANSAHFTSITSPATMNAKGIPVSCMAMVTGGNTSDYKPGAECYFRQTHHPLSLANNTMPNLEIGAEAAVIHSSGSDGGEEITENEKSTIHMPPISIHEAGPVDYVNHPLSLSYHTDGNAMYLPQNFNGSNMITVPQNMNKQGNRPLGRTQSAPLPLGHPILTAPMSITQTHFENSEVSIHFLIYVLDLFYI